MQNVEGFDWNSANSDKISSKHGVLSSEAEQVFFNEPLLLTDDIKHSEREPRYQALGITDDRRLLHVAFTLRAGGTLIRVISARDMHRKERRAYEQAQTNSQVQE